MTLQIMSMSGQFGGLGGTPRSARQNINVPFLPGYKSQESSKKTHAKSQSLGFGPGGALDALKVTSEPQIGGTSEMPKLDLSILKTMADPTHRFNYSARSMTHDERSTARESNRNTYRPAIAPAWLKHDRQVLRFNAYFQEPVHEDPKENFRVRQCAVFFYLEDGTMMISEPKVENAGIPQGTFVKRHRIPKPGGGYYTYQDMGIRTTISVYCRAFRLISCDGFTRAFYQSALGTDLGDEEPIPMDQFSSPRTGSHYTREIAEGKEYNELAHGGNRRNAKLQQYLENDRKVLNFKCYWDDPTRYGSRMYYALHYYLADDTVEILENLARNSGRDPYPVFWKRSPLRWNPHISPAPGMLEPESVVYKPEDMLVGHCVMVYGREITLYDCDDFTRNFYTKYMNLEQESMEIKQAPPVHVTLTHPPHTGFGTEEDSLASCLHLAPRPPKLDVIKLMAENQSIMRFEARLLNGKEEDNTRRFIVGFFVSDGSLGVWETKTRNSGHNEGKFAAKSRKKNLATGTWFQPQDFHVGATVEINSAPFLLLRADEHTLQYMESTPEEFPLSDLAVIANKLSGLRAQLAEVGEVSPEELQQAAMQNGIDLTAHELVALARAGGSQAEGIIPTHFILELMG